MSIERDELDSLTDYLAARICDSDGPGSDLSGWSRLDKQWLSIDGNLDVQNLASDLIHDGYRKPRTITTVEELDALPAGAIIRADNGWAAEAGALKSGVRVWYIAGNDYSEASRFIPLPATVLWEPQP